MFAADFAALMRVIYSRHVVSFIHSLSPGSDDGTNKLHCYFVSFHSLTDNLCISFAQQGGRLMMRTVF